MEFAEFAAWAWPRARAAEVEVQATAPVAEAEAQAGAEGIRRGGKSPGGKQRHNEILNKEEETKKRHE